MSISLMKTPPDCPYCGAPAVFRTSSGHLYQGRDFGPVYECTPCSAWVGCHKNGDGRSPLGTPANAETRKLRTQAHALFDPLWQAKMHRDGCGKSEARSAAYRWLAAHLGISPAECHISWMQPPDLTRVIAICSERPLRRAPTG